MTPPSYINFKVINLSIYHDFIMIEEALCRIKCTILWKSTWK